MQNMPLSDFLDLGRLLLELAVIPLIKVLWELHTTITDLKVQMREDFVSWERFNEIRQYEGKTASPRQNR